MVWPEGQLMLRGLDANIVSLVLKAAQVLGQRDFGKEGFEQELGPEIVQS